MVEERSHKKTLNFYWDNPPWTAGLYDSDLIGNDTSRRLSVMVHYEAVYRIFTFMPSRSRRTRLGVIWGISLALLAHMIEVLIFAVGYYGLILTEEYGTLIGVLTPGFPDCVYYSFVTYTTLGLGDLIPTGPLRFFTGIKSLTGLVLIAWTAFCLYFQMEALYRKHSKSG